MTLFSSARQSPGGRTGWAIRFPSFRQLKLLPQTLSTVERRVLLAALVVFVASALVGGIRLYQRHVTYVAKAGGTYSEALLGSPKFVNPILARTNEVDVDLSKLIFSSLYKVDEKGDLSQDLVTHEEISEDEKTYVLTLRQDAYWHDGVQLTAHDVAFTIQAIQDPEFQSPYRSVFQDVSVSVVDDFTITMELTEPYAPFLSTLTVGILPFHIWGEIPTSSFTLAEYNVKPIGSGPLVFTSLTKDRRGQIKSYQLVRFDDYYGSKSYLDEIHFRFYTTRDEMVEAVKRHKVDGISFVTGDMRDELANTDVVFRSLRLPQYTAIFFNQKNSLLQEKAIRQALAWAISKQQIIDEALHGEGEAIHTPILPGFLGHNSAVQGLAYDPDQAKKALDDAGWALEEGQSVRVKDGKELRFTLTTVDRPEYIATTDILKEAWEAIGVGLEIHIFSGNDILKKVVQPRQYEALLFGEIIGTDPDPYPFWHSSQSFDPGLNLAIFYNKQVDQLLEEARKTNDLEQRRLKYLHFQNILAEELPAIFLYNPFYTYGLPDNIKGFDLERISEPADRFNRVESWYIKTRREWH